MFRRSPSKPETDDVYVILVGELFSGMRPTAIMAATFVVIGLFAFVISGDRIVPALTISGALLSIVKLEIVAAYRKTTAGRRCGRGEAARWERRYLLVSLGMAVMVGATAARAFMIGDPSLELIGTGLLFGYGSGQVARISIRPCVARALLLVSSVPAIAAAGLNSEPTQLMIATMFAVFLIGGIESSGHLARAARQHIGMRLEMAKIARNDPLTGLHNRFGLREAFEAVAAATPGEARTIAVHCLDLDGFKAINDRYGHPVGDALLCLLADRMRAALGAGDIACRLGGDEFVVVQVGIGHAEEAELFARRLARALAAPCVLSGETVRVGASLGYATAPPAACDLDALLASADVALYEMKRNGGGIARAPASITAAA